MLGGPLDPCDVHVACSDLSGFPLLDRQCGMGAWDLGGSHVAASQWLEHEMLSLNVCPFSLFLVLNICIRIYIDTFGNCQFKLLF
jgi:hypothetical protein